MTILLEWAQAYADLGWWVFPCHTVLADGACSCGKVGCTDIGKHPRTPRGLKDASRDPAKLQEWFGPGSPPSNIAIVTGEISNLTILDIDIGPGKMGADTWEELIREHGEPETLKQVTGSGGYHILFLYNSALKNRSNVLGKNVDCRNDKGYIIAAPSRHRSGEQYKWLNWGTPLCALPAHLLPRKEEAKRGRPRKDDVLRRRYSLSEVRDMLAVVPADDRDLWRYVGIILGREFNRTDEAWALYNEWAAKWDGVKGRGHDQIMHEAFHEISQETAERELSMGTIVKAALDNGWVPKTGDMPIEDFIYYCPGNNYLYRPTAQHWIAPAVDAAVSPVNTEGRIFKASDWLRANRRVTSLACDPILEEGYIAGANCVNGEIIPSVGAALYNTYRKPTIALGDAEKAGPFLKHCALIFNKPGDADQVLNYLAHRVQRPGEKPRFALLIGGEQGLGKDTVVEFCCPAIGVWNVANIDPAALTSSFNEHAAATLVRINETAHLQDMSKWAFNELMKVLIAGSPDFCVVNPKYGSKYTVRLHCGVIVTTNHLLSGIFIPEDDRRYDVIECATKAEMGLTEDTVRQAYFKELWGWFYRDEGARHVAAYLHDRDLSHFSAALGQRKTAAHQTVVRCGMVGDEWAADAVEQCKNPEMISGSVICRLAADAGERRESVNARLSHALRRLGYEVYPNPGCKDGRWKIQGKLHKIFKLPHHRPEPGWEEKLDLRPLWEFYGARPR